jgi:hypothetical protein
MASKREQIVSGARVQRGVVAELRTRDRAGVPERSRIDAAGAARRELGIVKMATILDSFFVTVGLDTSQFTTGQKEAEKAWTKTKDQTVAATKQIEENTRHLAGSFDTLKRQAIEFFSVIMGADGIRRFIANVTDANTQLAVLSGNLQMQPQVISEWGMAIERAGGNAGAAMTSFQTIATNVFRLWQQGKQLPIEFMQLQAKASSLPGMQNFRLDPSNAEAFAESLAKASAAMDKAGQRGVAYQELIGGGIDPGMANIMLDHGGEIQKYLQSFHDLAPTDAQLKNSQALTESFAKIQETAAAAGRAITDVLAPAIKDVTDAMTNLISQDVSKEVSDVRNLLAAATALERLRHGDIKGADKEYEKLPLARYSLPALIFKTPLPGNCGISCFPPLMRTN